ncbi:hypothetical protein Taro_002411 [Colocasia esculenta]|uniref:Uncharacterized protein n=1 Tax=Colocasia esculenta TaxID=4460 RepID=A0A843TKV2_COLES|nr:hypothetical protein [Colocasia esculenta]
MLPSPVCSVFPVSGRFLEEECPEPPTGLKATHPVSPPVWRQGLCRLLSPEAGCASAASVFHVTVPVAPVLVPYRSPGARHLRACPVREVVTVTWDPRPREPVEGVLRATSVLELAATWADSGAEGKTVVRTVACESLAELSWLVWDAEDSESSQQRQGAHRAEETGR